MASDRELALEALWRLSKSRADDRESWIKVGMALHSVSEDMLEVWDAWSQQSDKYEAGQCEKQWRSFKAKSGGIALGSLIAWAREDSGDKEFGRGRGRDCGNRQQQFESVLEAADTVARRLNGKRGKIWPYKAGGLLVFCVVRIDLSGVDRHGKPKKEFRPIRRVCGGWEIGQPAGPLPLYRLPELEESGIVWVVEGEKSADAAVALGLNATTSAGGAQSPHKTDWKPLAGRKVVMLSDNDKAGRNYGQAVAGILTALEPAAQVRSLALPGLPPSGDIVEYIESERAAGKSEAEIRSQIERLAHQAEGFVGSVGTPQQRPSLDPDPLPLPDEKPPVAVFDYDYLPRRLQSWVRDIAERMQCPPDFLFVAVVVVMATLIGRKVGIRPKRFDVWQVVANLWGGAIGRSGLQKTPALDECLKPLRKLEREAEAAFHAELQVQMASEIICSERRKNLQKQLRDDLEAGGDGRNISEQIAKQNLARPRRVRFIVNDATVEKLGEILNENQNGVLTYRDELVGFLRSLDKQGQEGARGFYLEAWNGTSEYTYDRIGRGTLRIEAAIVSILGGIQPGPLREYLVSASRDGRDDDGLLQRFQLLVWPDSSSEWVNHDRTPDAQAAACAAEVFRHLRECDPESIRALRDVGESASIPYLRFSESAQPVFDSWRRELEVYLRSGVEGEAFESLLAKYRKLVPALALIFHLADGQVGPVDLESLERAIRASEYLKSHARRVYAVTRSPEMAAARTLASHLLKRDLVDEFTAGAVLRKGWVGLNSHSIVERAANILVDLNWLIPIHQQGHTGRPRERFRVRLEIFECMARRTDRTDESTSMEGAGRAARCHSHVTDVTSEVHCA